VRRAHLTFTSNSKNLLLKFAVIGAHGAPYEVRTLRLLYVLRLTVFLLLLLWIAGCRNFLDGLHSFQSFGILV
jgi:hypothetical protein